MNATDLTFTVAEEVQALGWTAVCFSMTGLRNRESDPDFERVKAESIQKIRDGLTPERIKTDPILQGFKGMHEAIAHSNRETVAAPETLLNLLLKHGDIPHINLLVDIYNLVSVETRLALGAHDIPKISGKVRMRLADGTENFRPIGADGPKKVRPGDYAYIDDSRDILCWLEVRQVEKTKVTPETANCFYIIQGNSATGPEYLREASTRLIDLTKTFCGGRERIIHAPWPL